MAEFDLQTPRDRIGQNSHPQPEISRESPLGRGRLVFGCVLMVLSVVPWVAAPFMPLLGLPAAELASVVAAMLIGAEIVGAIAIAVLGREAYARITRRLRRSKSKQPDACD